MSCWTLSFRWSYFDPTAGKMQPIIWVSVSCSPEELKTTRAVTMTLLYEKDGKPDLVSRTLEVYRADGWFDFVFWTVGDVKVLKVIAVPQGKAVIVSGDDQSSE